MADPQGFQQVLLQIKQELQGLDYGAVIALFLKCLSAKDKLPSQPELKL